MKWEKEARHVQGKKVRKALKKREKNYDYSSGSDFNPYTDEEVRLPCRALLWGFGIPNPQVERPPVSR